MNFFRPRSFILLCLLSLFSIYVSAAQTHNPSEEESYYELAKAAWYAKKENEAFIHVKNSLQKQPDHIPSLILMSELFISAGNMPLARTTLEKAYGLGADVNLILPLLGSVYVLQNDLEGLRQLGAKKDSFSRRTSFEWLLLQGQRYAMEGDLELARGQFAQAAEMYPKDTRALNSLAAAQLRLSNFTQVDELIKTSLELDDKNERTWVLKGEAAEKRGREPEAIQYYLKAFDLQSDDPKTLRLLAASYLKQKNYDEARKFLDIILDQSPKDPTALLMDAGLLMSTGNTKEAQTRLATLSQNISSLDTKTLLSNVSLLYIQGVADYLRGNTESAKAILVNYLAAKPDDVEAIRILFNLYQGNEEAYKAVALLENSQRTVSKDLELSAQLAALYIGDRKYLKTEQLLSDMQVHFAGHPLLTMLEARLLKARGLTSDALDLLVRQHPNGFRPLPYELMLAQLQLELGNLDAASTSIKAMLGRFPDDFDVLQLGAAYHLKRAQYEPALGLLDKASAIQPNNTDVRYNKAVALRGLGKSEDAEVALRDILKLDSAHIPTLLLLAKSALQSENPLQAHDWISKILVIHPANESALFTEYQIYQSENDQLNALSVLEKLLQIKRLDPDYLTEYALTLIRLKRFSELDSTFNLLLSLWSDNPDQLVNLAYLQIQADRLTDARALLEKAMVLAPSSDGPKLAMAQLMITRGEASEATKWLEKVSEAEKDSTRFLLLSAEQAIKMGDSAKAFQKYFAVLGKEQSNREALINLYELTKGGKHFPEFSQHLEGLMHRNPDPWLLKLAGDAYLIQGQDNKALTPYETLIQDPKYANNLSLVNNLANIYGRQDLKKGIKLAQPVLKNGLKSFALLDTVGWLLVQDGQFNDGLGYLREAYSMNASSGEVRYHIAKALIGLGREREALVELRAAIDSGEAFPGKEDAGALLLTMSKTSP